MIRGGGTTSGSLMAKLNKVVGSVNNDLSILVPDNTTVIKTLASGVSTRYETYFYSVADGTVRVCVTGHNYNSNIRLVTSMATSEDGFATEYVIIPTQGSQTVTRRVDIAVKRGVVYKIIFDDTSTTGGSCYVNNAVICGYMKELNRTQILYNSYVPASDD